LIAALDDLDKVVRSWTYRESVIKPTLHRRANGPNYWYRLQFIEETNDEQRWYNQKLNNCVEWAAERLKDWPNVKRMSFDMWDFKHRKDAEKFITLFHLSWDQ
jgi:hypothetical protein